MDRTVPREIEIRRREDGILNERNRWISGDGRINGLTGGYPPIPIPLAIHVAAVVVGISAVAPDVAKP